jgi:O-antigen biosynthesis protein WbqP
MIRMFDIVFSALGLIFLSPLMLMIWLLVWFDTRAALFCHLRVGRYQQPFVLVKFRTMRPNTVSVATHLVDASAVTVFGRFLRRNKLDELPQLWNVLKGEMSLVGPRPGLPNQPELTRLRDQLGVFEVRPGITGLAQVSGIDMSSPEILAKTDAEMISNMSVNNYFRYIFLTVLGKGQGDRLKSTD